MKLTEYLINIFYYKNSEKIVINYVYNLKLIY